MKWPFPSSKFFSFLDEGCIHLFIYFDVTETLSKVTAMLFCRLIHYCIHTHTHSA